MIYKNGYDPNQIEMMCLESEVPMDSPARVISAFVEEVVKGKVILYVYVHCFTALNKRIEECRNLSSSLSNTEKEVLPSYYKRSYCILGGICEISHKPRYAQVWNMRRKQHKSLK